MWITVSYIDGYTFSDEYPYGFKTFDELFEFKNKHHIEAIELSQGGYHGTDDYFRVIPNEICTLTNLKMLYIDNNEIEELPEDIGNLVNLHTLRCKGNKIKNIPKSIGRLVNLRGFDISNNQLTSLPSV